MPAFRILLLLLISNYLLTTHVTGQILVKEQLNAKEAKIFSEAKKCVQIGDFKKSIKKFEELLKLEPNFIEGILRLASNYNSIGELNNAATWFRYAIEQAPDFDAEMYYSMAQVLTQQKKYIEAASELDLYISKQKTNAAKVKKALFMSAELKFKDQALKNPVPFTPVNMGPAVNSKYSEYSPSLSLDGSGMIFTRNTGQEDFFIAGRDSTGLFRLASPVFQLNTPQNEGAHAISADGKFIVFTACDRRDSYGSCDLYYSILTDGKWNKPVNMGQKVNTAAWDSQPTLSPDGRTLIFSSKRLGTLGESDLWMTWRDDKNAWVTPVNLGSEINTEGNDETPFLHPDGKTIYFRSDGRPGMGSFDIYFSRKDAVTGLWQTPVNIGYPINTENQEGGLVVSLDGTKAYYSSDMDYVTGKSRGNLDIFMFDLYEFARPLPTTFIKGNVTDAITGMKLECQVSIRDVDSGETVFVVTTDKDGSFLSGITTGRNYACIIQKDGYQYYAHNFDMSNIKKIHEPYYLNIALYPIEKFPEAAPVILRNVFFATGSSVLLPQSKTEISLLTDLLQKRLDMGIIITGHTDNIGNEADNLKLSEERALSVVMALIERGISKDRLKSSGKGESVPLSSNDTEEGRQKNRRTEFVLYKMKL